MQDPDIDNLVMVIDTNACGRVMTGSAYAVREADILRSPGFPPPAYPAIDSFNAAVWTFESISADGQGCLD